MSKRRGSALAAAIAGLLTLGVAADLGPLPLGARSALAIVGRPLTPMSYAGVARRTTRRAAYAGAYAAPVYHPAPVAAGAAVAAGATVAALPGGCAFGGGIYTCGAYRYRPYYDGPNIVYVRL
jgi:hypothetical protein